MKKVRFLALILAALLAFGGCSMITIDEEMDNAEIVAEFNGGSITKGEARAAYQEMSETYTMYGYDINSLSEENMKELKQSILDSLAKEAIVKAKADELGFTALSDEERAELEAKAEEDYNSMVEMYSSYFATDDEEAEESADEENGEDTAALEQSKAFLETNYGYTLESVKEQAIQTKWQDALFEDVTKDVVVTDEQKEEAYQALVTEDETTYSSNAASFESAMTNGTDVAWIPEGYRTVKHILIKLTDDEISALSSLKSELSSVKTEITEVETAIADEAAAEEAETEEEAPVEETAEVAEETPAEETAEESAPAEDTTEEPAEEPVEEVSNEEKLAELQSRQATLESEIAALEAAYTEELMPRAQEALDLLAEGVDFDEVIAQYGEDPGMQNEPTMSTGYYVSANSTMWEQVFTDTAMALANVGDVSEPVLGSNGLHIIKYMSDVTAGPVDNEELRSKAAENAETDAKQNAYDAAVEEWVAAANVKTYLKKFD